MSLTMTLTQHSNELISTLFPAILLNEGKYEIGLLSFDTYNSIPNVDETNNAFHFGDNEVVYLPTGTYELDDIFKFMQEKTNEHNHLLSYASNLNTFSVTIKSSVDIDFSKPNSIGSIIGFDGKLLPANIKHKSHFRVEVFKVHLIDILCNISSGSYTNGVPSHSLYAFSLKVGPGFKIHEVPADVIYLPVDVSVLDQIHLKITDQDGNLINFRNERITVRLHIRKI
jgi:hypothetical protein